MPDKFIIKSSQAKYNKYLKYVHTEISECFAVTDNISEVWLFDSEEEAIDQLKIIYKKNCHLWFDRGIKLYDDFILRYNIVTMPFEQAETEHIIESIII